MNPPIKIDHKKILMKAAYLGRAFQASENEVLLEDPSITYDGERVLVAYILAVFALRVKKNALSTMPKELIALAEELEASANSLFDDMENTQGAP